MSLVIDMIGQRALPLLDPCNNVIVIRFAKAVVTDFCFVLVLKGERGSPGGKGPAGPQGKKVNSFSFFCFYINVVVAVAVAVFASKIAAGPV